MEESKDVWNMKRTTFNPNLKFATGPTEKEIRESYLRYIKRLMRNKDLEGMAVAQKDFTVIIQLDFNKLVTELELFL